VQRQQLRSARDLRSRYGVALVELLLLVDDELVDRRALLVQLVNVVGVEAFLVLVRHRGPR